jgi:ariadne-1
VSLERFLHYYERWTAHDESMEKARQGLDDLRDGGGLEELAGVTGQPTTALVFVTEAY